MYSKILGPRPQGVMQSCYGATGGLARIVSPLLVTYLYANFGPRWTFVSVDSLVVLAVVVLLCTYRRLVPYHLYVLHRRKDICLMGEDRDDGGETGSEVVTLDKLPSSPDITKHLGLNG